MHRIDHATAAPGDLFTEGNPATATPATTVTDDWLNDVQENICEVVEAAGITLVKGEFTQLRDAIKRMITGGDFKDSVRAATTANITLSGAQTIDGVSVIAGDRVLVMSQSTGAENGIYVAAAGAWARATDADTGDELSAGTAIPVEEGTLNADTIWMLTNNGTVTIGTTALVFGIKSGAASTTRQGLVQLATDAEAQALSDALKPITPSSLNGALQGSNQSLAASGYQKLPGGLILQWGLASGAGTTGTITWPTAFTTACLMASGFDLSSSTIIVSVAFNGAWTTTQGDWYASSAPGQFGFIAIGY